MQASFFGALFYRLAIFGIVACGFGLLTPFLVEPLKRLSEHLSWPLDLLVHWQWLYAIGLSACALLAAFWRPAWLLASVAVVLPLLTAAPQLPSAKRADTPNLSIASVNILLTNPDTKALRAWLDQERPDIVVVLELSRVHAEAFATWDDYPYQVLHPYKGAFGIGLLSRLPLKGAEVLKNEGITWRIQTDVVYQEQRIALTAFHPVPPVSLYYYSLRDRKLRELAMALQATGQPAIIAGDFNATPWSSAFNGLAEQGWQRVMGLWPTWQARWRGWIGVPIDQVMVTQDWRRVDTWVGPDIGSDHLPVMVEVALPDS